MLSARYTVSPLDFIFRYYTRYLNDILYLFNINILGGQTKYKLCNMTVRYADPLHIFSRKHVCVYAE